MSIIGKLRDFVSQSYPPASHYTENDVPDLSGKVVVVTGGNTGIGKETTRVLLSHNAKVYMACRSPDRANAAIEEIKKLTGKTDLHFLQLDLSSLAAIREAAEELKSKETKLDVLFNNAGVMSPPVERLTTDGYDLQFGTNVLGHYLFTKLLLPLLVVGASQSSDGKARAVNTSSLGHVAMKKGGIDWDTLKPGEEGSVGDKKRRKMGPEVLYYQSKLGIILYSNELAKRYGDQGIVSTSLHPGTIESELGRHWSASQKAMMSLFIKSRPVTLGAITQLYAGTAPDAKDLNGKYLIPWARVGTPTEDAQDEAAAAKLWAWLEEQVGVSTANKKV